MEEKLINICNNTYLHILKDDKFKTSMVAGFFMSKLDREKITINALIPAVLMRGTKNYKTMKEINSKLDNMYGAIMDGSSDKIGNKQALQFYITTIEDEYALNGEALLNDAIKLLLEVIYNPLTDGETSFCEEYVNGEKENLKELIKARINDKSSYAISRTIEIMFSDDAYGAYKYGRIEDLKNINSQNLYEQYKFLLKNSEIHFYISTSSNVDITLFDICKKYQNEKDLCAKTTNDIIKTCDVKVVKEEQDVTQGKLVLGYNVDIDKKEDLYKMQVYNAILGGSSNSKMFQNVREKESLAYTARSTYLKHKRALLIFAGIEIDKYEKALDIIKKQVQDMQDGNFNDEDIKDAKVFIQNIMRSYRDNQDVIIDLNLGQIMMDMNDSIEEMIAKIDNITREDILYIASKVKLDTQYFLTATK